MAFIRPGTQVRAQSATVEGLSSRAINGTGVLAAAVAQIVGSGNVGAFGSGVLVAGAASVVGSGGRAPVFIRTPSPSFIDGISNTYDFKSDVNDDYLPGISWSLSNEVGLSAGLSFDSANGILNYTGIGSTAISQHTITATDSVGSDVSAIFDIAIVSNQGTALEALVNSLSAGQWGMLQTGGFINALFQGTQSTSGIFEYAYRMCWDGYNRVALFYGGDDSPSGYTPKAIRYTDLTDAWDQLPNPNNSDVYTTSTPRHSYGQNVLDVPNRKWYYSPMGYNKTSFYSTDLDAPSSSWTTESNISISEVIDGTKSFAHFPARNSIVMVTGQGLPGLVTHIAERNNDTGSWTSVWEDSGGQNPGLHLFAEYSDAHIPGQVDNGCVIFGGGSADNKEIWRYNPDGTITQLTNWPYATNREWSAKFTLVNRDAATQNILFYHDDEIEEHFAVLDPRDGSWTELAIHNAGISSGDGQVFRSVCCSVENYMVTMYCHFDESGGDSKVWIYKHGESKTLNQIAADADTLAVLDFETAGRHSEDESFYIRGGTSTPLNATTDPDSYLRNHINAPNFGTTNLTSFGLDRQLTDSWNVPWYSKVNPNTADGALHYPKVVSGAGEFEDIIGPSGRSCLEIKVRQGDGSLAGGEMGITLRDQAIGSSKPLGGWTFLTAGTGAEIWVRAAVWHDQNWINTELTQPGGGNTGAKLWNIHGDESAQSLEETITTNTNNPPGFYHLYSDGGAENYPDPSPAVSQQAGWRVIHHQIIVGDDGVNNGIIRGYLDEDTEPFFEITTSQHFAGVGGPLGTGLFIVATASEATNQGFWIYDMTSFITGKDSAQVHPDMIRRYDNIVIRKNTRCPPLRPD